MILPLVVRVAGRGRRLCWHSVKDLHDSLYFTSSSSTLQSHRSHTVSIHPEAQVKTSQALISDGFPDQHD